MRSFKSFGSRFQTPIQVLGGAKTSAIVHRPADSDNPADTFLTPHYMLRSSHHSVLKAGDIIGVPSLEGQYLLARHSTSKDFYTFYMFPATVLATWTRPTEIKDPLTGLMKSKGTPETLASNVWVMWQRERREALDLSVRVSQERYLVLTGLQLQLRDTINGKVVDRIDTNYGLTIAELQG